MKYTFFISLIISCCSYYIKASNPVDYVNPLMGTFSSMELSNGNTYPTVCLPFGMNNWAPHTGKMGSGFLYTYQTNFLYGFKQTHQASLWINDYGQFSIMPVTKKINLQKKEEKVGTLIRPRLQSLIIIIRIWEIIKLMLRLPQQKEHLLSE